MVGPGGDPPLNQSDPLNVTGVGLSRAAGDGSGWLAVAGKFANTSVLFRSIDHGPLVLRCDGLDRTSAPADDACLLFAVVGAVADDDGALVEGDHLL